MDRLGTASRAGAFHWQSLYTSQNTWNTLLQIRHMRRRLLQIPTGALRTVDGLAGKGQMTGMAGSIDTGDGDGANGADKAGSGTRGMGTQAEARAGAAVAQQATSAGHGQWECVDSGRWQHGDCRDGWQ